MAGNSGGIRTGVTRDFYPTDKGLARKDGRVFSAPQKAYLDEEQMEDGRGMDKVPALVADNGTVGGLSDDVGMVDNI